MAYEVMNKSPKAVNGQVMSTVIDIKQNDPYTIISREIDGDQTNTTDKKAIELVLEMVNEETTPKSEVKNSVKQLEEKLSAALDVIESQKETSTVLVNAMEDMIAFVYDNIPPKEGVPEDEVIPEENTEEEESTEGEVSVE